MTTPHAEAPALVETRAAFSRRLGVRRSTVTRWVQAGRVLLDPHGMVRVAESLALLASTRGGRDDVADRHARSRGAPIPAPERQSTLLGRHGAPQGHGTAPPVVDPAPDGDAPANRVAYQAEAMRWQNALLLLELGLRRGKLYRREDVRREARELGEMLRGTVERLIDQTAPRLAAAARPADRERLLRAELAFARRVLKNEFPRALRRLAQRADVGLSATREPLPS